MSLCFLFIFGGFAFTVGYLIGCTAGGGPKKEKEVIRTDEGCIVNEYIDFLNYDGTISHKDA